MNEIEPTFQHILRVWWSYLWRSILAAIGAMIAGGIVGFILGMILGASGVPLENIKSVCMPIGIVLGLAFSLFPMYCILGKDFGSFRLILVSKSDPGEPQV